MNKKKNFLNNSMIMIKK